MGQLENGTTYAIWNNKGGVGKTFLTYLLTTEYAKKNPDINIYVLDMCPQANLSEIFLGGSELGQKNLESLANQHVTVADYIKERTTTGQRLGRETEFFTQVSKINETMPSNLYLVAGDMDLDLCNMLIQYMAQNPRKGSWRSSRILIDDLIQAMKEEDSTKKVFFIDCNPSFATYTELAMIASQRILIPCTGDSSSLRGLENVCRILYSHDSREDQAIYDSFYDKASEYDLILPKIGLIALNRSRSYDKSASVAYKSQIEEIRNRTKTLYEENPDIFVAKESKNYVRNVKDGNTLSTILSHKGELLSEIKHGPHEIYGKKTQVNKEQIDTLKKDIDGVIEAL